MKTNLETIIKQYVHLTPHSSKKGWYPVVCKVCNDHGKKGLRAAFRFDDGKIGYNCFNDPSCNAAFDPAQTEPLSKGMERLLQAYNIPEREYEWLNMELLKKRDRGDSPIVRNNSSPSIKIAPDIIEMPRFFKKMSDVDISDTWRIIAEDYLSNERAIDPSAYPFYLSYKDDVFPHWKKWYGRLIIPFYDSRGNLIFYQGRDLTGSYTKKYLSPDSSISDKECILFGYDQLTRRTDEPIYIVEGFFDAFPINGVAVMGNRFTESMLFHLRRSHRPKVVIPDRTGKGYLLAYEALKEGWSISTPDISNCKDINDAVKRFGKLYTMKTIAENIHTGFDAEVNLNMYCIPDDKK